MTARALPACEALALDFDGIFDRFHERPGLRRDRGEGPAGRMAVSPAMGRCHGEGILDDPDLNAEKSRGSRLTNTP
jgi:hypothetical protein